MAKEDVKVKYPGFEGLIDFEKEQDSMSKIINAAIYTFPKRVCPGDDQRDRGLGRSIGSIGVQVFS